MVCVNNNCVFYYRGLGRASAYACDKSFEQCRALKQEKQFGGFPRVIEINKLKEIEMGNGMCYNKQCIKRCISSRTGCSLYDVEGSQNHCSLFVNFKDKVKPKKRTKPLELSIDIESQGFKKVNEEFFKFKSIQLPRNYGKMSCFNSMWLDALNKDKQEENNSYTFRGDIKIDHLINDCIKDNKFTFLAINKSDIKGVVIGISKQLPIKDKNKFTNKLKEAYEDTEQKAFYILYINKSDISSAVKELPNLSRLIKNRIRNTAKKLHKNSKAGKYSNKSETKVLVF